jgi:phytol kinase
MWAYGTVLLFETRGFAIIPPLAFTVINAISYRFETFKAMETGERSQLGTIYFPISFAAAIWIFWETPALLVASLMPLTWGDALASVFGRRYGHHPYTILGSQRSLEGSLTMFLVSWLATLIPLVYFSSSALTMGTALLVSGVVALGATLIEAVSPFGIDNLTIPAITALLLYGLLL